MVYGPRLLALVVNTAAEMHEKSWDSERKEYSMDLKAAIQYAVVNHGGYGFEQPALSLLTLAWNETLEWAKDTLANEVYKRI